VVPGQRYLQIHLERDGKLILRSECVVSDGLDAASMWKSLQGRPFDATSALTPTADDPQKAVLKGKIKITIMRVDRVIASALVDEIRLVRVPGSQERWEIPQDEVERTARAAGL
jgi:hypothetical protein